MFGILWAFLLFMGVMMMRLRHHESSYCLALFPLFLTFPYCVAVTVGEYKSLAQIDGTRGTPLQWFLWPPGLHDLWFLHRCTEVSHYCFITIKTNDKYVLTDNLEVVHRPAMFGSSMRLFVFAKVQAGAEEAVLTFDCIRHSSAPFIYFSWCLL